MGYITKRWAGQSSCLLPNKNPQLPAEAGDREASFLSLLVSAWGAQGAASGASSVLHGFPVLWAGYVGRVGSQRAGRMGGVLVSTLSSRLWPITSSVPKHSRARASQTQFLSCGPKVMTSAAPSLPGQGSAAMRKGNSPDLGDTQKAGGPSPGGGLAGDRRESTKGRPPLRRGHGRRTSGFQNLKCTEPRKVRPQCLQIHRFISMHQAQPG